MIVPLDYGKGRLPVECPDGRTAVIEPLYRPPAPNPVETLRAAIQTPIGTPALRQMVPAGRSVGISVCDITRAQPRQLMIEALLSEMPDVRMEDVTIFIATGTHRGNTPAEIEVMLGKEIARNCPIICHNSRNDATLAYLGTTRTGVPILLNRQWIEMEFKITTGFVEPHFFAGFSGGPKMVAPGLAGLETVMQLHNVARIGHANATWGIIEGNPVHDDIREIAGWTGVDFALDVILNRDQQIVAAFAGDIFKEHHAACAAAKGNAMRPVDRLYDVVVTTNSGYPLDQNLYQSVKGISAAAKIVTTGGTIICAAECSDGIPAHGAYGEILASCTSPRDLLEMIRTPGYSRADQWQVQIQAEIQLKARVLLKSDGLSSEQIRRAHLEPIDDTSAAIADALAGYGTDASVCVLPHGPLTIPYLASTAPPL
jgi:nickel-dependent lactate racemase